MNMQEQQGTHKIVEANRIVSLLKRLMKEQVPITVRKKVSDNEWYGTISEMLFHQGELLINEIDDVGSEQIRLNEGQYMFHSKLTGVSINFESTIIDVEKTSKKTTCRASYPKTISYHQRRNTERVGLWVDQKIPVTIQLDGDVLLKGHIRDISIDGLNACFYRIIPIAPNEILPACKIQLPSGNTFSSKLEVRGISVDDNIGQLHLRGKFLELNPDARKNLSFFVKELEQSLAKPD